MKSYEKQFLKKYSANNLLYGNVVFYRIELFSANRILNNIKINKANSLNLYPQRLAILDKTCKSQFITFLQPLSVSSPWVSFRS